MVDKSVGTAGTLRISDDGSVVRYYVICTDPATSVGTYRYAINGTNYTTTLPSGFGSKLLGSRTYTASGTTSLSQQATGTQGLGGAASMQVGINRPLPTAPSGLAVTRVSDTQHALNWSRNATYSSVVVQRRTDGGAWQQIGNPAGNVATFTDTTTSANRKYEYRVAGKTAAGQSGWSGLATVYTTPAAPTGVAAERTGNDIVVRASGVPPYATSYDVRDGDTVVATSVTLPWTHLSPNPATPHTYTVRAKVSTLASAYSAPSNTVQLLTPPNAPTGLAPNGAVRPGDASVRFSWTHNPVDSSTQTAYEVRYRTAGSAPWTTMPGTTAAFRDIALAVGGWEWEARTKGSHPDWSPWSSTATLSVIDRPGVAVTQPETEWDTSTLPVEWSWLQVQGRPQSAWQIELLNGAGDIVEERSGSGAATTFTLTTRLIEGDWTVRVRAATGDVWSDWAAQSFAVVFDPPALPSISGEWDESEGGVSLSVAFGDPDSPVIDLTNVVSNPSFEAASGNVEVKRNYALTPFGTAVLPGYASYPSSNPALESNTGGVNLDGVSALPVAGHPSNATYLTIPAGAAPGGGAVIASGLPAGDYVVSMLVNRRNGPTTQMQLALRGSAGIGLARTFPFDVWTEVRETVTVTAAQAPGVIGWRSVNVVDPTQSNFRIANMQVAPAGQQIPQGALVISGAKSGYDPDLTSAWIGTAEASPSVLRGVGVAGVSSSVGVAAVRSSQWAKEGQYSLRLIAKSPTSAVEWANITLPANAGARGTLVITRRQTAPITGPVWTTAIGRVYWNPSPQTFSPAAPNAAGETELRVYSATALSGSNVILPHGGLAGTADVWYDLATVVPGVSYAGPAFSGDTGQVEVGGVERRTVWNGAPHASSSSTAALPQTVNIKVERSVDGGETWESVADVAGTALLIDWESLSFGETVYRATALSSEGATAATEVVVEARSGALWLSGGDGFGATARLPLDPAVNITAGRQRALKQYAGRSLPVALTGAALSRSVAVSGRTSDRDDDTADVERLTRIAQLETDLFLFRDPDGRRIYGAIGDIQLPRQSSTPHPDGWEGVWGYSFTLTEATR
ncbi:fibronectin type III domain-containing protein [Microbacterium oxydans]|uniref:fibronectin type III domain-containing protein n=1 Tax=Microbacterium sp. B19(2022) TaxID=2914045 RepID=UPI001431496C|nr:fibronectin type III domain-containing protein [Microbacterium sp. B19(2022)]NJI60941.1 fibronectin type III domain-containing protein [Microbacterium sp. B19(2022)]